MISPNYEKKKIIWQEGYDARKFFFVGGFADFVLFFNENNLTLNYEKNLYHATFLIFLMFDHGLCDSWPQGLIFKNSIKEHDSCSTIIKMEDLNTDQQFETILSFLKNKKTVVLKIEKSYITYVSSNIYYKVSPLLPDDFYVNDAFQKNNI